MTYNAARYREMSRLLTWFGFTLITVVAPSLIYIGVVRPDHRLVAGIIGITSLGMGGVTLIVSVTFRMMAKYEEKERIE